MILNQGSYFGIQKGHRDLNDYIISITSYDQSEFIPNHVHQSPYASIVLQGRYLEKRNTQISDLEVDSSKILFRQMGYEHSNQFANNHGVCFNIELKEPNGSNIILENLKEHYQVFESNLEITKVINAFLLGFRDDELNCLVDELFASMVTRQKNVRDSNKIGQAVDYINSNFHQSLTIGEVANFIDVHPVYLARAFKTKMNLTIGEYLRTLRITKGYIELFNQSQSITNIALSSGHFDQSHFIKSFKQTYGATPLKYRNMQRLI